MPYETPQSITTQARPAIHLEGWGMQAEEVQALARTLQGLMPSLDWHAGDTAVSGALSLVLVDEGALAGDTRGAIWTPTDLLKRCAGHVRRAWRRWRCAVAGSAGCRLNASAYG